MLAAENGHLGVVKYLVQAGANKDKKSKVRVLSRSSLCLLLLSALPGNLLMCVGGHRFE
jgi:hypothetical protein